MRRKNNRAKWATFATKCNEAPTHGGPMHPRGYELVHSRSMNWVRSTFVTSHAFFSLRERHATFWVI